MTRQERFVLIVSILASLVAFLDGSVVNVALPAIENDFGGGLPLQQWVVNAYLLTLGSLILLAGSLSDLFGRKKILSAGLWGFALASLLCAAAPTGQFLIAARALQGVFGALLVPSSLALIISTFSGARQGKAIGQWTAWTGISFIIGPLVGGLLVDQLSWRYVFAINIIPIALTLWLLIRLKEEHQTREASLDATGAILGSLGLGALVYGLIEQTNQGLANPTILAAFLGGGILLGLFVRHEANTKHPMLPLELFKVRNFAVGNLATVSIYAALSVAAFLIVVFVQQIGDYTALKAGFTLLPVTLIMLILSPRFGSLAGRYGSRWFMTSGPLLAAIGFLYLLNVDQRVLYWQHIFPGVVMFGIGLSITVAPLTSAVLADIKKENAGIGSAINNAISRVAGLVATAAVGIVLSSEFGVAGFHRGVLAMVVLLLIGSAISAAGIVNHPSAPGSDRRKKKFIQASKFS